MRAGGEGEAAVAHDHLVTPCQHEQVPERIPEDLRVHVRVAVDEAGRHHLAVGVDHLAGALADAADGGDAAVPHADVGPVAGQAGSVDHRAVLDHQVVGHRPRSSRARGPHSSEGARIVLHGATR